MQSFGLGVGRVCGTRWVDGSEDGTIGRQIGGQWVGRRETWRESKVDVHEARLVNQRANEYKQETGRTQVKTPRRERGLGES